MRPALALLLFTGCVHFVPLPKDAQPLHATTDDGWEISLVRYRTANSTGRPVLLCHGISANDRNMDLDDDTSLARWFAAHGREAWTMSLRGTGGSDLKGDVTFDDFWRHDLPAAVNRVRAETHSEAIDYVGHSMGGMILYAYLAEGGQGIAAAATLGSPTNLAIGTLASGFVASVPGGGTIPSGFAAAMLAPFTGSVDGAPIERLLYNPENVSNETWARLMAYGTANIAGGVGRQLSVMGDGRFESADHKLDFRRDMGRITTPVLVVAGRLDRTAPVPAVKDGYRALGGPKEWLLISPANGSRAEYGHMDLVVGKRAPKEVWEPVLRFLDQHR